MICKPALIGTKPAANNYLMHITFESADLMSRICADAESTRDKVVMAFGKLGFISQFSYFPVLYMDPEGQLAVFSFPPLNSNIAIHRVG